MKQKDIVELHSVLKGLNLSALHVGTVVAVIRLNTQLKDLAEKYADKVEAIRQTYKPKDNYDQIYAEVEKYENELKENGSSDIMTKDEHAKYGKIITDYFVKMDYAIKELLKQESEVEINTGLISENDLQLIIEKNKHLTVEAITILYQYMVA